MTMTNKLIITLLFVSIAFFHCLAFRDFSVEVEEFEPPQQEEQEGPRYVPGGGSGEEESRNHPYHFRKQGFIDWFQSKEGFVKLLPQFTKRSPTLFRGIENYRFALIEMESTTFLVPHHLDADSVVLVLQGKGVIEFVTDKNKESFHIRIGDVVRVPSGVTHFVTNTNQTVPLRLARILVPVNSPGQFKDYFPSQSHFQQSYFTGFSKEVLSASFNVGEELLRKLSPGQGSRQMRQEIMREVTPDQIKELTKHATSPSNKHKEKKDKDKSTFWSPFNLLNQDPIFSNDFGHFHEAHPESFGQLQDLHISVSWVNMTQGSLFLPHFNSKATSVIFIENGCARFEMASPYNFQGEGEDMKGNVHKIVSNVCKGDVFIHPAGHPISIVSQDEDFVGVGFNIHASNNTRTFLAGKENMLSNLNQVATRLTFGVGSELAEELFTSQNYSYFAPTARSQQQFQEKHKPSFQSIFNFGGF